MATQPLRHDTAAGPWRVVWLYYSKRKFIVGWLTLAIFFVHFRRYVQ